MHNTENAVEPRQAKPWSHAMISSYICWMLFGPNSAKATCVLLIKLINLPYCRWHNTQTHNNRHSSFSNKEIKSLSAIKNSKNK